MRVTRSMEATSSGQSALVARERRTVPNGIWAMFLFLASETALFGTIIGTYFFLRFRSETWPPAGVEAPAVALPLALTAVLLVSVAPVVAAGLVVRNGRGRLAWWLVAGALVVQGGYLAWQIVLYVEDLGRFSPADSAYGSIYFTMLAVHHVHVLAGLLLSAWVLVRLATGLTAYRLQTVQNLALYWLFVALVAIPVVVAQVSPA